MLVAPIKAISMQGLDQLRQDMKSSSSKDYVMHAMNLSIAEMDAGNLETAAKLLDDVLARIESIYANNPEAAKARSLWYNENIKDFKGEPYERAMAYYYRSILYMMEGDYENARASAKAGQLQDAFAEEDQYKTDFALLMFIEGWASQQIGDQEMAQQAYAEIKKIRPDFSIPPRDAHVLILAETGKAPRKLADGVGHYELVYRRGRHFLENRTRVLIDNKEYPAYPIEDIFFQASTRGGRPVDRIIKGKVEFRDKSLAVGSSLTSASTMAAIASSPGSDVAGVGAVLGGVGGIATLMAVNTKTRADTRYWQNLPDTVHILAINKLPTHGQVHFYDLKKPSETLITKRFDVKYDNDHRGVAWVRSRSPLELK